MTGARWRLVALGTSQIARGLADGCAGGAVLLYLAARAAAAETPPPWLLLPAVVLAVFPLLGPVAGTFTDLVGPRRVLVAATTVSAGGVLFWSLFPRSWPGWLGMMAAGAALYGPARDAVLAPGARAARWDLTRVVCALRMAGALGVAAGLTLTLHLESWAWPAGSGFPGLAAVACALGLATVLPVGPLAPRAPAGPPPGDGFFREGRRLLDHPDTCDPLVALICFVALVVLGPALVRGSTLPAPDPGESVRALLALLRNLCLGVAGGAVLAAWQPHPSRILAVVPVAFTALLAGFLWRAHSGPDAGGPALDLLLGMMMGLTAVPLSASYLTYLPAEARARGSTWPSAAGAALAALLLGLLIGLEHLGLLTTPAGRLAALLVLATAALLAAWWAFFRDFAERVVELLLWPCYRVRAHGPGLADFPLRGPVLVLANHAAWMDGLWLAEILPRRVVPLMISLFYDRPVLHWLMSRVVRAIRVQDTPYRREAPELAEAVAALDRGDCVLMFPEGVLRRKDDVTLRHFGQGVWRILRERPQTLVVVCWIEGGWGSFTSHCQGPPLTGKPLDWRRLIDVAVEPPRVLDPAVLADQRATRQYLEQACLDARRHLGPLAA